MTRTYGKRMCKSEINIVPLLDVLLVLLLIFMATIPPIITQNIKVDLPNSTASEVISISDDSLMIVEVTGIGQYNMVVGKNRTNQFPLEQVVAEAQHLMQSNSKMVFLIGGAKDVPYNEIIKTINLLHSVGVKSVGLMTQPV